MRWRIYYGDGSTFSSDDGPPEDAPATGVQVVAKWGMPFEVGGVGFVCLRDYYCWHDDHGWVGHDQFGLWEYLADGAGWRKVLFGSVIATGDYRRIVEGAVAECRGDRK